MRRWLPLLLLAGLFTGLLLASPSWVHPRLEAELTRSLGVNVRFQQLRLRSHGADLVGLQVGDFLTANEVDAFIHWHDFNLHPYRLVLERPVLRLDGSVLRTLSEGRKPSRTREFPLVFEEGRLLLFGLADIAPLSGEWAPDQSLIVQHPQGGRWRLAEGRLTVEGASLATLAAWAGRDLPLAPGLVLEAALALRPPVEGQLQLPWGRLELSQEGPHYLLRSQTLGPLENLQADYDSTQGTLQARALLEGQLARAEASWRQGLLRAEVRVPRMSLGEADLRGLNVDLHGNRLQASLADTRMRNLALGPATLDLVLGPRLDGELRLARPLPLEAAQQAGLVPRIGFLRGVRLEGLRIGGSLTSPSLVPRFQATGPSSASPGRSPLPPPPTKPDHGSTPRAGS